MGDSFQNISNSTIINRSTLTNVLNKIKESQNQESAKALLQVAQIIEKSNQREATEKFNQFTEEMAKPVPKKSILKTLWSGITGLVPVLLSTTGIVDNIVKLFN